MGIDLYLDLLKDTDRVSAFFEAIEDYSSKAELAYDLGCGSGVLSYFLSNKFKEVTAIEIDPKAYACAKNNLKGLKNLIKGKANNNRAELWNIYPKKVYKPYRFQSDVFNAVIAYRPKPNAID